MEIAYRERWDAKIAEMRRLLAGPAMKEECSGVTGPIERIENVAFADRSELDDAAPVVKLEPTQTDRTEHNPTLWTPAARDHNQPAVAVEIRLAPVGVGC